jgi:hypothetical protein
MVAFTERFLPRFIEMAVGDVEETISLSAVKLMRSLQKFVLLTFFSFPVDLSVDLLP